MALSNSPILLDLALINISSGNLSVLRTALSRAVTRPFDGLYRELLWAEDIPLLSFIQQIILTSLVHSAISDKSGVVT